MSFYFKIPVPINYNYKTMIKFINHKQNAVSFNI